MAVLHRALCTWFVCLIFVVLLCLRLDERTRWSWFIVFIPMWLYDGLLLIYLVFEMVTIRKSPRVSATLWNVRRKAWYLACVLLKLATQIMVCIKLENMGSGSSVGQADAAAAAASGDSAASSPLDIPLYYIMIPLWIVLPITIVDLFVNNLMSANVC